MAGWEFQNPGRTDSATQVLWVIQISVGIVFGEDGPSTNTVTCQDPKRPVLSRALDPPDTPLMEVSQYGQG